MSIMQQNAYISSDSNNEQHDDICKIFQSLAFETRSSTGLEIATFCLSVAELIILAVSVPIIQKGIDNQTISVTIGGIKANDTVSNIIKLIKNEPNLLDMAKEAYDEGTLSIDGDTKHIEQFLDKLEILLNEVYG